MKNRNTKLVLGLIVLICAFFTTCNNPIMEKWWDITEDCPGDVPLSGVNFAVVFFDVKGGTPQPYPIRVLWDNTIPRIRIITHPDTNLGFNGWYDENGKLWDMDTRTVKKEDDKDGDGIITLTAQWAPNYVTVKFQTNYDTLFSASSNFPKSQNGSDLVDASGVLLATQKIIPGAKITEPPVLPTNGTHGLVGWFTEDGTEIIDDEGHYSPSWGDKWNFSEDKVAGPHNREMTLYARWSTYIRTIHLQVNGGTRPNGQELTRVNFTVFTGLGGSPGGKIIDPGPLAREGYTLEGWYTDKGVAWNFATSLVEEVDVWEHGTLKNDTFNIHARWATNIYYVTFNAAGGTPVPARQEIKHGDRAIKPPPMTFLEMAFNGWIDDSGNDWDFNKGVTQTMTLYATWVPRQYTVKFNLGTPPGGLHSIYKKPADQRITVYASEPIMPALPTGNTTNYSF
ncbi:MAG: InlB B-repeat-containing protein, partial [Spirochaetaceae bacterium]|nr:InlB B-repeat-containing protein [Spirochaetaceae bacterium]